MNKVFSIICAILLLSVMGYNFISCEKYILPELKLAQDTLLLADTAQIVSVKVTSNVKWSVSGEKEIAWISFTPKDQVKGDSTIIISIEANTEVEPRETSLTVTSETLRKSIFVQQDGVR